MTEIMNWIKNIFCFTVVLSVIYQFLPQNTYLKYIKVFGGIIMAILVMQPVLKLLNEEISLEEIIEAESGELELESAKQEIEAMMRYKETFFKEKLEEEYGSEIVGEMEELGEEPWD